MLLDIGLGKVDPSIIPSRGTLPTAPKSSGERFDLEFDAFQKTEQFFSEERLKYEAYENAVQELYSATGRRVENPYAGLQEMAVPDETGLMPKPSTRTERIRILSDALREAREKNPSLPDPDEIEAGASFVAKTAHDAAFNAGLVSSPWTGPAAFAGSVAGAFTDPINLSTLPLGVGRVTGSLALRILKTAAVESGIAGGTQALIEAATYDFKTESGIEPTPVFNVLAAATGGAVLGGGVRGLIEGVSALKARSLEQSDAIRAAARQADDIESNPLGPARVEEHLDRLDMARDAAARGEPPTVRDSFGTADNSFENRARMSDANSRAEEARRVAENEIDATESLVIDAQRIAADLDPDVPFQERSVKASALLDEAAENKRVANEISDACLKATI